MKIKIGVSARHVHICREDLNFLFGDAYQLTKFKNLDHPIEFASNEMVTIKTEKGKFRNVRLMGPLRDYTQIEISKTDAYVLGLNPPVRPSSDIIGSEPITIVYNDKELYKPYGCIIIDRHIHINKDDANRFDLRNNMLVKAKLSGIKGGVVDNVRITVDDDTENYQLHLDLDDANAHLVKTGDDAEIMKEDCSIVGW